MVRNLSQATWSSPTDSDTYCTKVPSQFGHNQQKVPSDVGHVLQKDPSLDGHKEQKVPPKAGHEVSYKKSRHKSGIHYKKTHQGMGIADNLYQATGNEQSNYNKHFGRGVPSRGMADQPRGTPQRRRKPHPSQHNKNKTGERLRNNKRGLRSKQKTADRKKKRSSAAAWSRQLYRYYRGHTLTGKASSGRRKQLAHDS